MLVERAGKRHHSQSSSTLASSAGKDVGGCYVEVVHLLEHLANRAQRRLARFFRRLRRRYASQLAAGQPGDLAADGPRADATQRRRRRRRRRRHRDLDPRSSPSDMSVTAAADNSPRLRAAAAEQLDAAPPTHAVVAPCRVSPQLPHTASELFETDSQSSAQVSALPRRVKLLTVANNECPQIGNTGLSRSIYLLAHELQAISDPYCQTPCLWRSPRLLSSGLTIDSNCA